MSQAPEPRKTLDPDQVAFWLARHPDFLLAVKGCCSSSKCPTRISMVLCRCWSGW